MSIIRLIYVTVQPNQVKDAVSLWKNHCAPLMIKQPGCLSEKLWNVSTRPGNSFPTPSGITRRTSTSIVKAKRTQKSRNTRVPYKVERHQ
jgi:hypothetical protein